MPGRVLLGRAWVPLADASALLDSLVVAGPRDDPHEREAFPADRDPVEIVEEAGDE